MGEEGEEGGRGGGMKHYAGDARMRTLVPEDVVITGSALDDQEGSEAIPGSIDVEG